MSIIGNWAKSHLIGFNHILKVKLSEIGWVWFSRVCHPESSGLASKSEPTLKQNNQIKISMDPTPYPFWHHQPEKKLEVQKINQAVNLSHLVNQSKF